jgi:acyl-CoA dehydrogenase
VRAVPRQLRVAGAEAALDARLRVGELILAIAMTEPGTGSDLAAIKTTAVRDGDDYVMNGAKTFISNGQLCDLVIVAAKTDPDPGQRPQGHLADRRRGRSPGFVKGKQLEKMGMAAQDTSELFFEDCRVPRPTASAPRAPASSC